MKIFAQLIPVIDSAAHTVWNIEQHDGITLQITREKLTGRMLFEALEYDEETDEWESHLLNYEIARERFDIPPMLFA
jgi:hypothetical protein